MRRHAPARTARARSSTWELTWLLFLRILDRARDARGGGGRGRGARSSRRRSRRLPLAGLGRAGRGEANRAAKRGARRPSSASSMASLASPPARHARAAQRRPRQKVISEISLRRERVRIDTSAICWTCSTKCRRSRMKPLTHARLPLSQVYEGLLLKMGRRTTMAASSSPRARSYEPWCGPSTQARRDRVRSGCGTGGFLIEAFKHMRAGLGQSATATQLDTLGHRSLYGPRRRTSSILLPCPTSCCTA